MSSDKIIATLRHNEKDLRARGVRHAASFGSVARGDQTPESDIDIEPETILDVCTYVGQKIFIAEMFTGPVDIVDRGALRQHLRAF